MDYVYSFTIYAFSNVDGLNDTFIEVGPPSYWGILNPTEDEIICDKYEDCTIPFYEFTFSIMGVRHRFISFEVEVLNYLVMGHSQLHPTN